MLPILVSPPAELPATVDELKGIVSATGFDDDNDQLEGHLEGAVSFLDGYYGALGRCLVTQKWKVHLYAWSRTVKLPFPDISNVAIKYRDRDLAEVTVAEEEFELIQNAVGEIFFKSSFDCPALGADLATPISIEFDAGFGGADDVPANLKQAILFLAAGYYDPGLYSDAEERAQRLYRPYMKVFA